MKLKDFDDEIDKLRTKDDEGLEDIDISKLKKEKVEFFDDDLFLDDDEDENENTKNYKFEDDDE
jgi:hypothetical protein